ncbi:zinc metallochaperone AztD [Devosia sp.]|uniref:zinc metallochaperone AztD n=1 Tax=Devosia sp. TaxID=1871048 RepID=UPI0025E8722A|nr:zinc metallochaperone AztD [Devosia sp.]MCR6633876.1 zinc metallochaperone AztD [Devosia sp.]
MRHILTSLLLATALTVPAMADDVTAWRLFVSDHAEGKVTALDAVSGDVLGSFALKSPASLVASESGEAVFAVQGAGNQVSAIRSGIAVDDHGDHGDIEVSEPTLVDAVLEGEKPAHFVQHDGKVALFFDGSGKVDLFSPHEWADEGKITATQLDSGTPHHGLAVPWGDFTLVSTANAEDEKKPRIGLNVIDAAGNLVGETHACPDLHGEAASGNLLIVGCGDGVLIVSGSGEPQVTKLDYAGLPEGKTTTLIGGKGMQYFLGNYGADKVVIIDPAEAAPYRLVDLPTRRVHFVADSVRPKFAYIFTEDGFLRQLDVVSGELVQSVKVTEPYSMDGEWSLPRPRIAVAGDKVAVTDPLKGVVHMVDVTDFALAGEIAVDGAPYNIVAVGGSGSQH